MLSPELIELEPAQVRMLRALADCEAMAQLQVQAGWVLSSAAKHFAVDADELALLWLQKVLERERARLALASSTLGDEEADQ